MVSCSRRPYLKLTSIWVSIVRIGHHDAKNGRIGLTVKLVKKFNKTCPFY